MSSDGIVWATAVYRMRHPGVLEVTEQGCEDAQQVPVVMTQAKPTTRGLVSTPWTAPPGSTWEEDEPGVWWIQVYRLAVTGSGTSQPVSNL